MVRNRFLVGCPQEDIALFLIRKGIMNSKWREAIRSMIKLRINASYFYYMCLHTYLLPSKIMIPLNLVLVISDVRYICLFYLQQDLWVVTSATPS